MRPESLRLVLDATRINPSATLSAVARETDRYAEALIDVYVELITKGAKTFDVISWDDLLAHLNRDQRTLAQFIDTLEVRTLLRSQETSNANS